ncbi:gliding motility lipoprotein GldD [Brumimicrobium salinarum]|uniref:Gliding motility lipoprotein GldD n=1 Tax=Brumimicrobium salinarum TaxID=2058658 RepID=A0A2I0R017_9FLAO|nr:gliding motility lipoprotein GldD [Brumimicrobium salinarum]
MPKPSTYLELNLPEKDAEPYTDKCGYTYLKPNYFNVKNVKGSACNRDVDLSSLNGTLHLSRIDVDTSLGVYINYAIDKVEEHKIMATAIYDSSFIRNDDQVYGTFFELQGNVASPFQFYLTDSTSRFLSGVVYFNTRPNYDSIRPTLDFLKDDIFQLMESLKWE